MLLSVVPEWPGRNSRPIDGAAVEGSNNSIAPPGISRRLQDMVVGSRCELRRESGRESGWIVASWQSVVVVARMCGIEGGGLL